MYRRRRGPERRAARSVRTPKRHALRAQARRRCGRAHEEARTSWRDSVDGRRARDYPMGSRAAPRMRRTAQGADQPRDADLGVRLRSEAGAGNPVWAPAARQSLFASNDTVSTSSSPICGTPRDMPKSERLIFPLPSPPQRSFAVAVAGLHLKRSIFSETGFVTPSSVRLPSTVVGL